MFTLCACYSLARFIYCVQGSHGHGKVMENNKSSKVMEFVRSWNMISHEKIHAKFSVLFVSNAILYII